MYLNQIVVFVQYCCVYLLSNSRLYLCMDYIAHVNLSLRLPSGITNILYIMNGTNKSLTEIFSFGVGVCGVQPTKRSTHQVPRTRRWCQRKHNKLWWRGWWRRRHDSLRHHTAADTHRRTSTRDGSKAGMYVLPRALRQILVFFYNPRF